MKKVNLLMFINVQHFNLTKFLKNRKNNHCIINVNKIKIIGNVMKEFPSTFY